jgi:hypothetical protein
LKLLSFFSGFCIDQYQPLVGGVELFVQLHDLSLLCPKNLLFKTAFFFSVGFRVDQHQPLVDGVELLVQLHDLPQLLRQEEEEEATSSPSHPASQTLYHL